LRSVARLIHKPLANRFIAIIKIEPHCASAKTPNGSVEAAAQPWLAINESVESKRLSQTNRSPQCLGGLAGKGCLEPLLGQTAARCAGDSFFEFGVCFIFSTASQQKLS